MRAVQASEAKIHLPQLLDQVEQGETIQITRHGRAIARLVPEPDQRRERLAETMAKIEELRKTMPRLTIEEILSARDEGRKY